MLLCSRLKPIDIVVLKKLSEVVNVVPVIAKSDSLTIEERHAFKQRVCSPNDSLFNRICRAKKTWYRSKRNWFSTISNCTLTRATKMMSKNKLSTRASE